MSMPPAEGIGAAFDLRNAGRSRWQLYGELITNAMSPNSGAILKAASGFGRFSRERQN